MYKEIRAAFNHINYRLNSIKKRYSILENTSLQALTPTNDEAPSNEPSCEEQSYDDESYDDDDYS